LPHEQFYGIKMKLILAISEVLKNIYSQLWL